MTFVITQGCCNDASCVPVCPVQCIRPRPGDPDFASSEQLYIDPATCIDCGACLDECPVSAIYSEWDIPASVADYLHVNAEYFEGRPIEVAPPPSLEPRRLPAECQSLAVAIVGSGPAGCYAAMELSSIKGVKVSMFDQLPTPFGLVRAGVAPDHPNTKLISDRFSAVLGRANVQCFFNVQIGRDVTIEELLQFHHAIIWAGGADDDRRLGIPGEDLPGCHSAREFVAWYNGHPDYQDRNFDLRGTRVVVIGNGNVALDVARVLAQPVESLTSTDIADAALAALRKSQVTDVLVAARRGPEHAAYTSGELIALDRTRGINVITSAGEITSGASGPARPFKVLGAAVDRVPEAGDRSVTLRYGLRPVRLNGDDAVDSVTFEQADGSTETIEASLVLRAIGYRARPVPGLTFDDVTGTLPHELGRVYDPETGLPVPGTYCAGWIKRGATGVIGTNKMDSKETVASLLDDLAHRRLVDPMQDVASLVDLVGSRQPDYLDKQAWLRVDQVERRAGRAEGRPRIKFVHVNELMKASRPGD
jgi:ferredoxin--NADP+ reductase